MTLARTIFRTLTVLGLLAGLLAADQVNVRRTEGAVHGFLVLKSMDGKVLANGDLLQESKGNQVTSQLIFHFKDGSLHHETAVFSQNRHFKLLSDHLIQKGPAFKNSIDVFVDCAKSEFTAKSIDKNGEAKDIRERINLPADLSNGIVLTLLKNMPPPAVANLSMVVATPKPQMLRLKINSEDDDTFRVGGITRKATRYRVKIEIPGAKGLFAGLLGKQPPDTQVWILEGDVPAFVKSEGPFFDGGPIWRIELTSPTWPAGSTAVGQP